MQTALLVRLARLQMGLRHHKVYSSLTLSWQTVRHVLLFVDHSVPLTTRVHSSLEVCSLSIMLVQELTFHFYEKKLLMVVTKILLKRLSLLIILNFHLFQHSTIYIVVIE